jgi:hypothetical protein
LGFEEAKALPGVMEPQGGPLQGDQPPPAYTREDAVRHYKMVCKHRRDWVEEREEFGNNDDVVRSYLVCVMCHQEVVRI